LLRATPVDDRPAILKGNPLVLVEPVDLFADSLRFVHSEFESAEQPAGLRFGGVPIL